MYIILARADINDRRQFATSRFWPRLQLALWNSANRNPFAIFRIKLGLDSANYERVCHKSIVCRKNSDDGWLFKKILFDYQCYCYFLYASCAVIYTSICSWAKIKMSWLQPKVYSTVVKTDNLAASLRNTIKFAAWDLNLHRQWYPEILQCQNCPAVSLILILTDAFG